MTDTLQGLKVGLVGPIPPPAGGMANQTRQLRQLLEQEGAQVELVAVNAAYRPSWIAKIPGLRAIFRLLPYLVTLWRTCRQQDVVHIMANSGWSWHLFATPAVWLASWRKKPVILNYRGGHADEFFNRSWHLVAPTIARCAAVVVPSPFLHKVFAKYQTEALIVPNVLNKNLFYPAPSGRDVSGTPHLIVTRNLEAIYDVATALRTFALVHQHYPAAHLTIAGTGPELNALQQLASQLKLAHAVHFCGRLTPEQMAELYRSADVLLNTSLVDNSPNSLIEAMACGVPVVSTNVGGIPDLVNHNEQALLAEPGQPVQLADYVRQILSDMQLRQRLIDAGLQRAARFDWTEIRKQLAGIYRQAIRDRSVCR